MSELPSVLAIEQACVGGWPALETVTDGTWQARFAEGYTKRANSIQSFDPADDADAAVRLNALSQEYVARGLAPTFRQTPLAGPGILAALDAAGWGAFEHSLVLAMPQPRVLKAVGETVRLFEPDDPEWFVTQSDLHGYGEAHRATLAKMVPLIAGRSRGLIAYDEAQQPVAAALTAVVDGIGLYFNVGTLEAERGKGYGRAVMHAAINWAGQAGASHSAIQVLADNVPAVSLYTKLGFIQVYGYHYRRPLAS